MVHVALLAVICWARGVQSDYGKLLSLAVTIKVPSEGMCKNTAAELLSEYGCDELRDVLRKKGMQVSGVKGDIFARLCDSRKACVVDERMARPLAAVRQQSGHKLPLAAVLDREAATAWIRGAIGGSERA